MDADNILKDLQNIMQMAGSAQVVSQLVQTYDAFALAAMRALLSHEMPTEISVDRLDIFIAESAWKLADAMMAERKKRGLGGVP